MNNLINEMSKVMTDATELLEELKTQNAILNEELQQAYAEIERFKKKYYDLLILAPIQYVTPK